MKSFIPFALLAIGVAAQDSACGANYIVSRCLEDENGKAKACAPTDYNCQCAAYQAIATCYNNCPNDPRAGQAQQQVSTNCANASRYSSSSIITSAPFPATTTAGAVPTSWYSGVSSLPYSLAPSPTIFGGNSQVSVAPNGEFTGSVEPGATNSFVIGAPTSTGGAGEIVRNNGGMVLALAGVMAAML